MVGFSFGRLLTTDGKPISFDRAPSSKISSGGGGRNAIHIVKSYRAGNSTSFLGRSASRARSDQYRYTPLKALHKIR